MVQNQWSRIRGKVQGFSKSLSTANKVLLWLATVVGGVAAVVSLVSWLSGSSPSTSTEGPPTADTSASTTLGDEESEVIDTGESDPPHTPDQDEEEVRHDPRPTAPEPRREPTQETITLSLPDGAFRSVGEVNVSLRRELFGQSRTSALCYLVATGAGRSITLDTHQPNDLEGERASYTLEVVTLDTSSCTATVHVETRSR